MSIAVKMQTFAQKSSWIRKMFEEGTRLKAQYGAENVFDFSLGNPDVPPPARFREVLRELAALDQPGLHGYMANGGYPYVRETLAAKLGREQEVPLGQGEIVLTCGAAGALNVVMKTLLNPGEEVVILAPYFVEYHFYVDNHGGVVKVVNTRDDFTLDLAAIQEVLSEKTKAVLINSPNNPTGQIYSAEELRQLGDLLAEAGKSFGTTIYLIADEPYRKIVYDDFCVPSVMLAYRNSIVISSYSKDLSLPGERIGYLAVHPEITEKTAVINAMILANRILGFVNAPALMQRVVERLQEESVDINVYRRRRELFCQILDNAGYEFVRPRGAFYLFPKSPIDDIEFCGLLQQQNILAVPGTGFGAPGYFRLAFCVDEKFIQASAEGFKKAIAMAKDR